MLLKYPSVAALLLGSVLSAKTPLPSNVGDSSVSHKPDADQPSASAAPSPSPAPVIDFSEGFKLLAGLGLPVVTPSSQWHAFRPVVNPNDRKSQLVKSLKGQAWFTPGTDGKFFVVGLGEVQPFPLKDAKTPSVPALDPLEDVDRLMAAIRKVASKSENSVPFSSDEYRVSRGLEALPDALIFAVQLYQTGRVDAANRLAAEIFSKVPDRNTVIDGVISLIASEAYSKVADAFFSTGDWSAYQTGINTLVAKFPRGWKSAPAVRMLADAVQQRISTARPPTPKLDGVEISPAASALLATFADYAPPTPAKPAGGRFARNQSGWDNEGYGAETNGLLSVNELWLLGNLRESAHTDDTEGNGETHSEIDQNNNPAIQLTALGIDALPALASMIGETYLTRSSKNSGAYHYDDSSDDTPEERAMFIYQQVLYRPISLGEIASHLLASTLPDPENEGLSSDPDTLRELALAFWKEHRHSSREQLAMAFLTQGNSSQASQAAQLLVKSASPAIQQALETHILSSDEPASMLNLVQTYLKQRREAAKPFLTAYVAKLREQVANSNGDSYENYVIKEAGGINQLVKSLEALGGGLTPRAQAVQIAKGPTQDAKHSINNLLEAISELSPTKQLYTMLEGASAANDAEIRAMFLAPTLQFLWPGADRQPVEPSPLPAKRTLPAAELKVWKKLLSDTRRIPNSSKGHMINLNDSCVAELAACAFEWSISPTLYSKTIMASSVLEQPASTLLRQRANARINGQPSPVLPEAGNVDPAKLKQIVNEVATLPPTEVRGHLSSLSPDERAAWQRWFMNPPDDLPHPDNLRKLGQTIVQRTKESGHYPDTPGIGGIEPGFEVTPESLLSQINTLASDIEHHSRAVIYLLPTPFPPGLQVYAFAPPIPVASPKATPEETDENKVDEDAPPNAKIFFSSLLSKQRDDDRATGWIEVSTGGISHIWKVSDGKAVTIDPSTLESFNEGLRAQPSDNPATRRFFMLRAISAADARAIQSTSHEN